MKINFYELFFKKNTKLTISCCFFTLIVASFLILPTDNNAQEVISFPFETTTGSTGGWRSSGDKTIRDTMGVYAGPLVSGNLDVMSGFLQQAPLSDYDFQQGKGSWEFTPPPEMDFPFTAPEHSDTGGILTLNPADENTFGFFGSPFETPMKQDTVYMFKFAMSSNMSDLSQVPRIRLRISVPDFQESPIYDFISMTGGEASPGISPLIYKLFYYPSQAASQTGTRPIGAFFDLINIGDEDSLDADINLHYVTAETFPATVFSGAEQIQDYTFAADTEGWELQDWTGISTPFTAPDYNYDSANDRLELTVNDTENNFGFWELAPGTSDIPADSSRLYHAVFSISTDNPDETALPKVRCRIYSDDFQATGEISIDPNGDADLMPVTSGPRDYHAFLIPSSTAQNIGLTIDLIALDAPGNPRIDNGTTIRLHGCRVERMDADQF